MASSPGFVHGLEEGRAICAQTIGQLPDLPRGLLAHRRQHQRDVGLPQPSCRKGSDPAGGRRDGCEPSQGLEHRVHLAAGERREQRSPAVRAESAQIGREHAEHIGRFERDDLAATRPQRLRRALDRTRDQSRDGQHAIGHVHADAQLLEPRAGGLLPGHRWHARIELRHAPGIQGAKEEREVLDPSRNRTAHPAYRFLPDQHGSIATHGEPIERGLDPTYAAEVRRDPDAPSDVRAHPEGGHPGGERCAFPARRPSG